MNGAPISRHAPQRTCIGCRKVKAKGELLRLVVSQDGRIVVDRDRKMPGRGVYLCALRECWESGLKRDKLSHCLRAKISPVNREELVVLAAGLASQGVALGQPAGRAR